MKTVFENDFITMHHIPENFLSTHIWKEKSEHATDEDVREIMVFWRKFVMEHGVKYHIIDSQKMRYTIAPDMQEWIAQEIVAPAVNVSFKKMATILPSDLLAQLSAEQSMDENVEQGGIEVEYFDNVEKARNWLLGLGKQVEKI